MAVFVKTGTQHRFPMVGEDVDTPLAVSELKLVWKAQFVVAIVVGLVMVLTGILDTWTVRSWIGLGALLGGVLTMFTVGSVRIAITPSSIQQWRVLEFEGARPFVSRWRSIHWDRVTEVNDEKSETDVALGKGNLIIRGAANGRLTTIRIGPMFTNYAHCVELLRVHVPGDKVADGARQIMDDAFERRKGAI